MLPIILSLGLSVTLSLANTTQKNLTQETDQILFDSLQSSRGKNTAQKVKLFKETYERIKNKVNQSILNTEISEQDLSQASIRQIVALSLTELLAKKSSEGFTSSSCQSALSTLSKARSEATKKEPALIRLRERVQKFILIECNLK